MNLEHSSLVQLLIIQLLVLRKVSKKRQQNIVGKKLDICFPFELQKNDCFKFSNLHSGAVMAWFCVLLAFSVFALTFRHRASCI